MAVVRGFIVTMAAQEREVHARLRELQAAGSGWSEALSAMGDDDERVAAGYLTDRERTMRPRSVGIPPAFDEREELVVTTAVPRTGLTRATPHRTASSRVTPGDAL